MNEEPRARSSWWLPILSVACSLILGAWWALDHQQQQSHLQPVEEDFADKTAQFENLHAQVIQANAFDGYDSWEEMLWAIDNITFYRVFEDQAKQIASASDEVYEDVIPKLIALLDDEDANRRQNAWRLLQCAQASPRFAEFESDYRQGVVALLRHQSIRGYYKLLPWLLKEEMNSPEVLSGLRQRMMDDDDPFAPHAAYTLAELDPTADIGPRLVELIEKEHEHSASILHRLDDYLPEDQAEQIIQKHQN